MQNMVLPTISVFKNRLYIANLCVCRLMDAPSKKDPLTELEKQLHEKEMKLTDVQLEALTSAHQLEQMRNNMTRMKVCITPDSRIMLLKSHLLMQFDTVFDTVALGFQML